MLNLKNLNYFIGGGFLKKFSFSLFLSAILSFLFVIILISYPQEVAEAVKVALILCSKTVIPSLFPFFVLSKFITGIRLTAVFDRIFNKLMKPLFSVSGSLSSALILGICGGYPIGASTCADIYNAGNCTKKEAERALLFCNNCGPAFIIGAIGSGVFKSTKTGVFLLIIHILSAVAIGIFARFFSPINAAERHLYTAQQKPLPKISTAFTRAVSSSLSSILAISAYIVIFSVIVRIAGISYILPMISGVLSKLFLFDCEVIEAFLSGILEMTTGAFSIVDKADFKTSFVLISALLGWGGISVHFQTLSALEETDLDTKQYFIGKLLHGAACAIFSTVFACIFL